MPSRFSTKQPVLASQPSAVHGLLSLQSVGVAVVHRPAAHASPVVQALPSSQLPLWSVWVQPVAMSHASAVQLLPSSHADAVPETHWLLAQLSPAVQRLPSSHVAALGRCTQPVEELQESSVHTLPSAQSTVPSTVQAPPAHLFAVQAFPSSQAAVLLVKTQPLARSQVLSVHGLLSSQSALTRQPTSGACVVSPSVVFTSGWLASASGWLASASATSGVSLVSTSEPVASLASLASVSLEIVSGWESGLLSVSSVSTCVSRTWASSVLSLPATLSAWPLDVSPQPVSTVAATSATTGRQQHSERIDRRIFMFITQSKTKTASQTHRPS